MPSSRKHPPRPGRKPHQDATPAMRNWVGGYGTTAALAAFNRNRAAKARALAEARELEADALDSLRNRDAKEESTTDLRADLAESRHAHIVNEMIKPCE